MTIKNIDMVKFMPVTAAASALLYLANAILLDRIIGWELPYPLLMLLMALGLFWVGMLIRLGHLPWFETKDGKKQRLIVWLESAFPFLRGPSRRK